MIKTLINLRAAFAGFVAKAMPQKPPVIPEAIKRHAPKPSLRPSGSMRAGADAVDQRVREASEAKKARAEHTVVVRHKPSMRMAFRMSRDDQNVQET